MNSNNGEDSRVYRKETRDIFCCRVMTIDDNKAALLVFNYNEAGNAFWENRGFTVRDDLTYRNKVLREMVRIDT